MTWPIIAGCGTVVAEVDWGKLPDQKIGVMMDVLIEQRLCSCGCGSHLSIELPSCGVHPSELEML